jgi:hypothetical protein
LSVPVPRDWPSVIGTVKLERRLLLAYRAWVEHLLLEQCNGQKLVNRFDDTCKICNRDRW